MFTKFQFRIENFGFKSSSCHFAAQAVLTANFIRNLSCRFTDQFEIPLEFDYHLTRKGRQYFFSRIALTICIIKHTMIYINIIIINVIIVSLLNCKNSHRRSQLTDDTLLKQFKTHGRGGYPIRFSKTRNRKLLVRFSLIVTPLRGSSEAWFYPSKSHLARD